MAINKLEWEQTQAINCMDIAEKIFDETATRNAVSQYIEMHGGVSDCAEDESLETFRFNDGSELVLLVFNDSAVSIVPVVDLSDEGIGSVLYAS